MDRQMPEKASQEQVIECLSERLREDLLQFLTAESFIGHIQINRGPNGNITWNLCQSKR